MGPGGLYNVHDISLDGIAFDYDAHPDTHFNPTTNLEIFFMTGPILYIENIYFTIVADIPLRDGGAKSTELRRRVCSRLDDLTSRQIISFKHLLADHLID